MARPLTTSSASFARTSNSWRRIDPMETSTQVVHAVRPEHEDHGEREHHGSLERIELARIAFVALCAVAVGFRVWESFTKISVIG